MTGNWTCACGAKTLSFVDVINEKGLFLSEPCCYKCALKLGKTGRKLPNGDFVENGMIARWHNREYKKSAIDFIFRLAAE